MKMTFTTLSGGKVQIDFTVKGYSYKRKKESARNLAIELQRILSDCALSYSQLSTIGGIMKKIGERFGLLTEFRENGIC